MNIQGLLDHLVRRRSMLVMLPLMAAAGCESESNLNRAPVSGIVSVGGENLESGVIRFVPIGETRGPMAMATIADGRYALSAGDGPVIGTHRVEIEATNFLGFNIEDENAYRFALRESKGRLPRSPVPGKYRGRSPLRANIPPEGREGLDFRLK